MQAIIEFQEKSSKSSIELNNIKKIIENDYPFDVQALKGDAEPGVKSEIILGLEIAGLAISGVSALISVLTYWKKTKPDYSISIEDNGMTIDITNLNKKQFEKHLKDIENKKKQVKILIVKG